MIYVVRRKNDDKYYSFMNDNWETELNQQCWLSKEEMNIFKEKNRYFLKDYLFYTILNPNCEA